MASIIHMQRKEARAPFESVVCSEASRGEGVYGCTSWKGVVKKKFNTICKVDYVTNNLAECFNAKFKLVKGYLVWQAFDKIRQMIMIKMALCKRIADT